jgi:hypothetical protein
MFLTIPLPCSSRIPDPAVSEPSMQFLEWNREKNSGNEPL